MTLSAILLAAALLTAPGSARVRDRAGIPVRPTLRFRRTSATTDPAIVASTFDLLSVCLKSGMAVPAAAAAVSSSAPEPLAGLLRRAADMLALGADPAAAWSVPAGATDRHCESLLRLARRSASSGAALADGVAELAASVRTEAADTARAAAERASVLIAGPLGLCYLPAFVCLGIVPVVAGLASKVLGAGLI
jgi:pilus assembly protein TadC